MALDGIVTRAIANELRQITGSRISKIYQPNDHDLIFVLRGAGGGGKLLLSANPTYPRVHFTTRSTLNPSEAPMFCMLMRKHCEGGVIERIEQVGMERILHLSIRQRDELGDESSKTIIIELMGRHSNIILTDAGGTIIDGIHHVTPAISSYRIVMPGVAYTEPPQQHKRNPLDISREDFAALRLAALAGANGNAASSAVGSASSGGIAGSGTSGVTDNGTSSGAGGVTDNGQVPGSGSDGTGARQAAENRQTAEDAGRENVDAVKRAAAPADPAAWIVFTFSGISPLVAGEIAARVESPGLAGLKDAAVSAESADTVKEADTTEGAELTDAAVAKLWEAFRSVMEPVRQGDFHPVSGTNRKGKLVFSAIPLTQLSEDITTYHSISECMEDYYGDKAERDTVKQRVSDLLRFLTNERAKNLKKLDKLQEDLEEAGEADRYRIWGELLFASLHAVSKGDKEARLINYYDENQAETVIPLDPLLTPSDNAQRYFKKYNKYKNSLAVIDEQLAKTREEIAYLENLLQQLGDASLNDIEEIRDELVGQGYLRDRSKKGKKKKKNARPTLHQFISSEGVEMYVGKNNLQNEYVTNRLAAPNDTWLHTKDIPGSHVVIRSPEFGEKTLEEAAQLAAYFSQAKQSSSVPVDYTLIRHVRKPSGSKPGFVIYDHQKTLFVTPDEALIKALPNTVKN